MQHSEDVLYIKTYDALGKHVKSSERRFVYDIAGSVDLEEIVETGTFDPDSVHLPGIYVNRIVLNATPEKRIEKRTLTQKAGV